jgi:NADPH:quinone reductase-like Zn-dependent oxidoreductase
MPGMKVIFPHVSGSDVAGVVAAIGSEVSGTGFGSSPVQVGDEVVVHPGVHLADEVSVYPRLKLPSGIRIPAGTEVAGPADVLRFL